MRSIVVSAFILLTSVIVAPAAPITITSGSRSSFFNTSPDGGLRYSLSSANLTINIAQELPGFNGPPIPAVCNTQFVATTCTIAPSYTDNSVPTLGAVVDYNGTLYLGGTLTLAVNVIANSAVNTQTVDGPPDFAEHASFANDPFSFIATASFSDGGSTIFSSLTLIGSGIVSGFAFQNIPQSGFDHGGNITYTFQGVSAPEPSSMAFTASGILGLLIGIERRRRSHQRGK